MKHIYLSGAITCYLKDNNIKKAIKWREEAEKYFDNTNNFKCINPMRYYPLHTSDFESMKFDLRKVKKSYALLVNLEDLYRSLGTSDEILQAWMCDIPIIGFLEDKTLINTIHEWKKCQIDRIEIGKNAQKRAMEYIKTIYE